MKNKSETITKINLSPSQGEKNNFGSEVYHSGITMPVKKGTLCVYFVNCIVFQQETNSEMTVSKQFEDVESAKKFMDDFIQKNPLSEVILYREEKEELFHYV